MHLEHLGLDMLSVVENPSVDAETLQNQLTACSRIRGKDTDATKQDPDRSKFSLMEHNYRLPFNLSSADSVCTLKDITSLPSWAYSHI